MRAMPIIHLTAEFATTALPVTPTWLAPPIVPGRKPAGLTSDGADAAPRPAASLGVAEGPPPRAHVRTVLQGLPQKNQKCAVCGDVYADRPGQGRAPCGVQRVEKAGTHTKHFNLRPQRATFTDRYEMPRIPHHRAHNTAGPYLKQSEYARECRWTLCARVSRHPTGPEGTSRSAWPDRNVPPVQAAGGVGGPERACHRNRPEQRPPCPRGEGGRHDEGAHAPCTHAQHTQQRRVPPASHLQ
jgi:hypothetical protein